MLPKADFAKAIGQMEDITPQLLGFKEAARHLWNVAFLCGESRATYARMGHYQDLLPHLFDALVLQKLGISQTAGIYGQAAFPDILVVPAPYLRELPVMVNLDTDRKGSWLPERLFQAADLKNPTFIEFFSWDAFSFVDLEYVRCRSNEHKSEFLVSSGDCRFVLSNTAASGAG